MEKIVDSNKSSLTFNLLNVLLVILTAVAYAYWKTTRSRLHKLSENIPGPKGLPFIGSALDLLGTPHGETTFLLRLQFITILSQKSSKTPCLVVFRIMMCANIG
jgi:cytochrome P450 family 4